MTALSQLPSGAPHAVHSDAFHRVIESVAKAIDGLREGLAAKRAYDHYRAQGASHTDAVTRAFNAGYNT